MEVEYLDYANFKALLFSGPFYFHWYGYESRGIIKIWSQRDQMMTVYTEISNDPQDAQYIDFQTWSWQAGDWDYKKKSWVLDYTGVAEHDWQFVSDSGQPALAMLNKGFLTVKGFEDGDVFQFEVFDKDGIYAPPGYVFRQFVDVAVVDELGSGVYTITVDPKTFDLPSRSKILYGLWLGLRLVRKSSPGSNPEVFATLEYDYKEQPV